LLASTFRTPSCGTAVTGKVTAHRPWIWSGCILGLCQGESQAKICKHHSARLLKISSLQERRTFASIRGHWQFFHPVSGPHIEETAEDPSGRRPLTGMIPSFPVSKVDSYHRDNIFSLCCRRHVRGHRQRCGRNRRRGRAGRCGLSSRGLRARGPEDRRGHDRAPGRKGSSTQEDSKRLAELSNVSSAHGWHGHNGSARC
jgi:hypothetical protein